MTYPNKRDCRHGRQRGHCVECELEDCEQRVAALEREVARLKAEASHDNK